MSIARATYDRDNGDFECRMKEGGTGNEFYSKSVKLTVLLQPSPPTILTLDPTLTEGKTFNLTCQSTGGSPAPQIKWFLGDKEVVEGSQLLEGATKDEPTRSVLSINPKKEDDGNLYKCTVWNRALGENANQLQTSTKIYVNCKSIADPIRSTRTVRARATKIIIVHKIEVSEGVSIFIEERKIKILIPYRIRTVE